MQTMTPAQMNAALAIHSARAEPIIPDGWQVPNGYILRGPRGNKGCVGVDANGNVPEFDVRLWLDGMVSFTETRRPRSGGRSERGVRLRLLHGVPASPVSQQERSGEVSERLVGHA